MGADGWVGMCAVGGVWWEVGVVGGWVEMSEWGWVRGAGWVGVGGGWWG